MSLVPSASSRIDPLKLLDMKGCPTESAHIRLTDHKRPKIASKVQNQWQQTWWALRCQGVSGREAGCSHIYATEVDRRALEAAAARLESSSGIWETEVDPWRPQSLLDGRPHRGWRACGRQSPSEKMPKNITTCTESDALTSLGGRTRPTDASFLECRPKNVLGRTQRMWFYSQLVWHWHHKPWYLYLYHQWSL